MSRTGSSRCPTSSTSRLAPPASGNDFFTSLRTTAGRASIATAGYRMASGLTGTPIPPFNSSGPSVKKNS
jgi:hypothetical protein